MSRAAYAKPNEAMGWFHDDGPPRFGHIWATGQPVRILGNRGTQMLAHHQWTGELVWRNPDSVVRCEDPDHPRGLIVRDSRHEPVPLVVSDRRGLNLGGSEFDTGWW